MTDAPLFSIITPVRNGIRYLEGCIQSVLNQSYPNIEHFFVDGGSTDGTLEVLARYHARYPNRVKFISAPDKGVGDALNKGLQLAKGDIFGWIDSDDIYEPDAISTVAEFFRANSDASFVYGNRYTINENGEIIGKFVAEDFDLKRTINDRQGISFCAALYRREVIERVGPFHDLGYDLDFWIKVGQIFHMHRIDATLSRWRLHEDSISGSSQADMKKFRRERVREDYRIARQYGAGIFSPRAMRYFRFLILDTLHLYPLVNKVYPPIQKILGRGNR